jgi:putative ATPase
MHHAGDNTARKIQNSKIFLRFCTCISCYTIDMSDHPYTLFDSAESVGSEPLASRMRPLSLDEFAGQGHILGPGRLLRRAIQADQLSSIIFSGPPGTGKTTIAMLIAGTTKSLFLSLNAVLSGVKQLRESIATARENKSLNGRKSILFVDEVHRWNKAQQDALLPWVENGTIVLIGATTENPYFEVNSALVSRSRVFQLLPLTDDDLKIIGEQALRTPIRGYGEYDISFEAGAMEHLVRIADGDARSLLNAIQLAVETTPDSFPPPKGESIFISLQSAEESIQKKALLYDKEGDYHFDTISAFIKSIRGSDPDAALYWMARMLQAGEDPRFIFRRMLIAASEDVGLADPAAITVVESAASAFDRVGMPEGRFFLAQAALYLAVAEKSNSTLAFFDAINYVENEKDNGVPSHLKDANRDQKGFGHGEGYMYPHAYRDHWVAQQYLPGPMQGKMFYQPGSLGYEGTISARIHKRRETQINTMFEDTPPEVLTFSPPDKKSDLWLKRMSSGQDQNLRKIRNTLFELASPRRFNTIAVQDSGSGLLVWEALRRVPEGGVWCLLPGQKDHDLVSHYIKTLEELQKPVLFDGDFRTLLHKSNDVPQFDYFLGRNVLTRESDKKAALTILFNLLTGIGELLLSEVVPSMSQRLSGLIKPDDLNTDLLHRYRTAEDDVFAAAKNPLVNWGPGDIEKCCLAAGFDSTTIDLQKLTEKRIMNSANIEMWFDTSAGDENYGSVIAQTLTVEEIENIKTLLLRHVTNREIYWEITVLFLKACKG